MHVGILTREFPPDIYGGAGVHVDFLVRELRRLTDVRVSCFGAPRDGALAYQPPVELACIIDLVQRDRRVRLAGQDRLRIEFAGVELEQRLNLLRTTFKSLAP